MLYGTRRPTHTCDHKKILSVFWRIQLGSMEPIITESYTSRESIDGKGKLPDSYGICPACNDERP